ncbi:MAG TPA: redoxin domain-containing protein [Pirellulales bacterium]
MRVAALWAAFALASGSLFAADEILRAAYPAALKAPLIGEANAPRTSRSLGDFQGEKLTVVAVLSPSCPISNAYVPLLNRLANELTRRGGNVVGVYVPGPATIDELQTHRRDYELAFSTLHDERGEIAKTLGLAKCPAVCVFGATGKMTYRGRIDDRYARRAGAANKVVDDSLNNALAATLTGTAEFRETEVVGCPISFTSAGVAPEASTKITYAEHVAPILAARCQQCHRPGGIGPFSLMTYDETIAWADDVKQFTQDRTMPPWKPAPGHGEFHNSRRLTDQEISHIAAWVEGGRPLGDVNKLPAPREFPDGWTLGQPDLVLEPSESFTLAAEGEDEYRCFVLPTNFAKDQYVAALEVRPGNSQVVHHVLTFVDVSGTARQLDAADPAPGYKTGQGFPGFFPSGALGGWAPGNTRGFLPEGMAKVLPAGADVVVQIHYHRTGKPEVDRTRFGLFFAKGPVDRSVVNVIVGPLPGPLGGLRIPAGAANHEVKVNVPITQDSLAVSITPHMHLIGKDMRLDARLPSGEHVPLVYVKDWDFNWQETYQYKEPVLLPKGTMLELVAHYDNSAENLRNPSRPPRLVTWGEQTTDEMCLVFIEAAPVARAKSPADLKAERPGDQFFGRLRYAASSTLESLWRSPSMLRDVNAPAKQHKEDRP